MSYMSFVARGELSGGIKYAVGEMSGRGNVRHLHTHRAMASTRASIASRG